MKHLSLSVFLFGCIPTFAQTGEKNFIDLNYIEVTGKAEMQISPDLIYLKIRLSEQDKSKLPIAEQEKRMTDKLQEIGIDAKKDMSVNDLLSRFKSKVFSKDIVISKEYRLTVHEAKMASNVFLELEKLEISNVTVDRLDHTKMEEFRRELKVSAIKAAKEKAEALTKAINQNIGKAIYIVELQNRPIAGESNTMYYNYSSKSLRELSDKDNDSTLDFEKIKLEYSVLTRFELK